MMYTYIAFVLIGSAAGQIIRPGVCPDVAVKQGFDVKKFTGKWYEAERYFNIFEIFGKCVTATYDLNDNGTVCVVNKEINRLTGRPFSSEGFAMQDEKEKAKLKVNFPHAPFAAPYWIVDTDYESYAVIWSCKQILFLNARFAWLLTRDKDAPAAIFERAYAVFDKNQIDRSHLGRTNQKDCPVEPQKAARERES